MSEARGGRPYLYIPVCRNVALTTTTMDCTTGRGDCEFSTSTSSQPPRTTSHLNSPGRSVVVNNNKPRRPIFIFTSAPTKPTSYTLHASSTPSSTLNNNHDTQPHRLYTIMNTQTHALRSAQQPLYANTSPPVTPTRHATIPSTMHRLSGSTLATAYQQTPSTPTTQFTAFTANTVHPAQPGPMPPAFIFPQDLPPRPAPNSTWTRLNIAHYIFPRPTVPARPADIEMGTIPQRRYVSGGSAQERGPGRWSKSVVTKIVVVLSIVAVFWILIILGIVLGSKNRVAGSPGR